MVGNGVVKPLINHVEDLLSMPPPMNKLDVQSFLGCANYYAWMMTDFGFAAAPLHRLTGEVPFEWGGEQQRAFESIKRQMADVSAMGILDLRGPFEVVVDASEHSVGAILQQRQGDGKTMPIAYHRRRLTTAEEVFHIRLKEMLAAIEMLQKYEHWLRPVEVTVFTDHRSLIEIAHASKITGRFQRWIDVLQSFHNLKWQYIKGEDNPADWLSRPAGEEGASEEELRLRFKSFFTRAHEAASASKAMEVVDETAGMGGVNSRTTTEADEFPVSVFVVTAESRRQDNELIVGALLGDSDCAVVKALPAAEMVDMIRDGYAGDDYLSDILGRVEAEEPNLPFFVNGGLLFHDSRLDGTRLCVPKGDSLNKILFAAHDANGHVGCKTVSALNRFYFNDMRRTVNSYISGCSTCTRAKAEQRKQQGLLIPFPEPDGPRRKVSVDVVGGFPESRGYTCILVVVDYFTKSVRAAPMPSDYDSELIADCWSR